MSVRRLLLTLSALLAALSLPTISQAETTEDQERQTIDLEKMEEYVHPDGEVHFAPTRLVCLENTHTHCGGAILPFEHLKAIHQ